MKRRSPAVRAAALAVLALAVATSPGVVAQADPPEEVDQALLVPTTLDSAFAPFTCRLRHTGPVCTGERHLDTGWVPLEDFPCDVALHNRFVSHRYQTRYYDHDYLNYDRDFRSRDTDHFSTTPGGPATATITTRVRFFEPFAVPGDDSTRTIVTSGTIWDVRGAGGASLLRTVGTLVEPPGEVGTFTGHVTRDGVTTRYEDAPLDEASPEGELFEAVCRAATGG
jgi:hypothetical protein